MKNKILQQLSNIEAQENVKILYACESGSRAWGFPSKDSDYDVRFIYIRDVDWYLRVDHENQRDVVERPIDDLLDINGWDLKKSLLLLRKGNPTLVEWFSSPIVYRKDDVFADRFKALMSQLYSPRASFYHYIHMAKKNNRGYLQEDSIRIKKYFYVLRPLLACLWIERDLGIVPMEFERLVTVLIKDEALLNDIQQLLADKRKGFESEYMPRVDSISDFINEQLINQNDKAQAIKKIEVGEGNYDALNSFFLSVLHN